MSFQAWSSTRAKSGTQAHGSVDDGIPYTCCHESGVGRAALTHEASSALDNAGFSSGSPTLTGTQLPAWLAHRLLQDVRHRGRFHGREYRSDIRAYPWRCRVAADAYFLLVRNSRQSAGS